MPQIQFSNRIVPSQQRSDDGRRFASQFAIFQIQNDQSRRYQYLREIAAVVSLLQTPSTTTTAATTTISQQQWIMGQVQTS
mmetsp:Transcript_30008/g.46126  ORF Transcript_30008/g.46126 Transcript_30008/m.46126 type:complete len:81 (-) Transcript_30008:68-310(-)